MRRIGLPLLIAGLALAACAGEPAQEAPPEIVLGPADGRELPAKDLERVQVGDLAPDFTLTALVGPPVTLSSYRGMKNVVLVFYRGHW